MASIEFKPSALKQTKWYEYLVRFIFGGLLTAATGLITKHYGFVIGGLFLALPSIFPATVTLVQSHEKKQEEKKGDSKEESIEKAHHEAGMTSDGTALGAFGLLGFAIIVDVFSVRLPAWLVLVLAQVVWLVVAVFVWWVFTTIKERRDKGSAGKG